MNNQPKTIPFNHDKKKKYEEFNKMLEVMKEMNYDYSKNESFLHILNRKNKKSTIENHISALIYSQLSANRPWKQIEENKEKINKIFNDFDPEYLKKVDPEKLENEIKSIKCGNRLIHKQMSGLKDNILMFEKIEKEYGSLDNFVTSDEAITIAKKLSKGEYKLKGVGLALACEYLKCVGIDCIKPDIHIRRILGRFGYSKKEISTENEAINIIDDMSKEYNMPKMEIDTILWQYCAKDYLGICGENPKCHICKIKCNYSKSTNSTLNQTLENSDVDARNNLTVYLEPLKNDDEENFIKVNQKSFNYGALEEFGLRNNNFEEEGQIISRKTIAKSIKEGKAFNIIHNDEIVGGVVINIKKDRGYLELLFIKPTAHNKGLGYATWCAIEKSYPEVKVWETMTPYFEKRNIHFYVNRCGFHIVEFFNDHHQNHEQENNSKKNTRGYVSF